MNEQQIKQATERMNEVLELLDELHSAASDNEAEAYSGMTRQELLGFLREVSYTAQEAIKEVQQRRKPRVLHVVQRVERVS